MIAIAMMKMIRGVGGSSWMKATDKTDIATRLMWIPGIRPVKVPAMMPRRSGIIRLSILG